MAAVDAFRCAHCSSGFVDPQGYPVPIPLPEGTILSGNRGACSYCGLALKSTPGTVCLSGAGRAVSVPYFGAKCYVCGNLAGKSRKPAIRDDGFIQLLRIPFGINRLWQIDPANLLNSSLIATGESISHIVYSPETKELVLGDTGHPCEYLAQMYITDWRITEYVSCRMDQIGILDISTEGPASWLDEIYFVLRRLEVPTNRLRVCEHVAIPEFAG